MTTIFKMCLITNCLQGFSCAKSADTFANFSFFFVTSYSTEIIARSLNRSWFIEMFSNNCRKCLIQKSFVVLIRPITVTKWYKILSPTLGIKSSLFITVTRLPIRYYWVLIIRILLLTTRPPFLLHQQLLMLVHHNFPKVVKLRGFFFFCFAFAEQWTIYFDVPLGWPRQDIIHG